MLARSSHATTLPVAQYLHRQPQLEMLGICPKVYIRWQHHQVLGLKLTGQPLADGDSAVKGG